MLPDVSDQTIVTLVFLFGIALLGFALLVDVYSTLIRCQRAQSLHNHRGYPWLSLIVYALISLGLGFGWLVFLGLAAIHVLLEFALPRMMRREPATISHQASTPES